MASYREELQLCRYSIDIQYHGCPIVRVGEVLSLGYLHSWWFVVEGLRTVKQNLEKQEGMIETKICIIITTQSWKEYISI